MTTDPSALLARLLPVWKELADEERAACARHTNVRRFRTSEHIQGRDAGCAGVLLVAEGSLRAYMLSESGREIMLFRVETGECCVLAASCILPMIGFDIALDAASDCKLLVMDPGFFSDLIEKNVHVEAFAYRQTALRFSDCMWVMQQVLFSSFDARLAAFLLDELARTGETHLVVTHDEIARHLGSAREVVSRMLKYFEHEGLVALSRGSVDVLDRSGLRALV